MNCNYFLINNLPLWDQTIPLYNQTISLQNFIVDILQTNFATITLIPNNVATKRIWQFVLYGFCNIDSDTIIITYDMSLVNTEQYWITFEGRPYGILQIGNQSYNANQYMYYNFSMDKKYIKFTIHGISLSSHSDSIFYNIFLNDVTATCGDYPEPPCY
jgi:hypothetical protein